MLTGDGLLNRLAVVAAADRSDEPFAISPAEFQALPSLFRDTRVPLTIWGRRVVVTDLWSP